MAMAVTFDRDWRNQPTRTPNMTGQGEHDFIARATVTAPKGKDMADYRVEIYQTGTHPADLLLDVTVFLEGRMLPESHRGDIRAAAMAAYRAAFLGLTPELVAHYKAARAIAFTGATGKSARRAESALAMARRHIRNAKPLGMPSRQSWGAWGRDGERWLEHATGDGQGSPLVRFVGFADDLARIDHKGWYLSDDGSTGETYRGAVWQLPSRGGRPVFVPGYVESVSGADGGRLDFSNLQIGEPGGDGDDAKRSAAYAGDSLAERDSEKERDYQRAWMAGRMYCEALEEAKEAKAELRELLAERRAARLVAPVTWREGAICRTITAKARELCHAREKLLEKAAKLLAGDYAERHLFAYWSRNDEAERDAFCEAAGLSADEFSALV